MPDTEYVEYVDPHCELCRESGTPIPPPPAQNASTTPADQGPSTDPSTSTSSTAITPGADRDADGDPIFYWIGCMKCSIWYHSVCLLLRDDYRDSVPEPIRSYLEDHGGIWKDWTGFVDRWYCSKCTAWSIDPANPHPSHHPLRPTLNRRTWPPKPKPAQHTPSSKKQKALPQTQDSPVASLKASTSKAKSLKRSSSIRSIRDEGTDENTAVLLPKPKKRRQTDKNEKPNGHAGPSSNGVPRDLTAINRFYPTITDSSTTSPSTSALTSPILKHVLAQSTGVNGIENTGSPAAVKDETLLDGHAAPEVPFNPIDPLTCPHPLPPIGPAAPATPPSPAPAEHAITVPTLSNGDTPQTPPVKEELSASRPKRQAALNRPDYHALHHHVPTPTARWLDLIHNSEKYGVNIKDGDFPRVPGKLISRAWVDTPVSSTTSNSIPHPSSSRASTPLSPDPLSTSPTYTKFPAHLPPTLFYGPFREPLVIRKEDGGYESLGGKLPDKDLTVGEISRLVGPDHMVDVIDVATQSSSQWTMGKWAEYVSKRSEPNEAGSSHKVYNIISLEISGTELGKRVNPPQLVRDIDWVENFWQFGPGGKAAAIEAEGLGLKEKEVNGNGMNGVNGGGAIPGKGKARASQPWPKVQLYCLMGTKGSWTDWHVDFAASSVYYTVHRGAKTFFFIRPTERNLAAYADWSGSYEKQQSVWLGDMCDEVRRVTLREGDTMIIPAGYIHSVHTPEDSIVFGGNFLHSYDIPTQLRLRQIEIDTKVPQRFRYPHFDRLCWYVAVQTCAELRQLRAYRPRANSNPGHLPSLRVLQGMLVLAQFLCEQVRILEDPTSEDKKRKLVHDRIPSEAVKDPSGLSRELKWRVERELQALGALEDEQGEVRWNTEVERGKEPKKKENHKDGTTKKTKGVSVFPQKGKGRTWDFHPPAWNQNVLPPVEHVTQIQAPRPRLSPKNGERKEINSSGSGNVNVDGHINGDGVASGDEAEERKTIYHQQRSRIRYLHDGSVVLEEQDSVFTQRTVTWRPLPNALANHHDTSGHGHRHVELGGEIEDGDEGNVCVDLCV